MMKHELSVLVTVVLILNYVAAPRIRKDLIGRFNRQWADKNPLLAIVLSGTLSLIISDLAVATAGALIADGTWLIAVLSFPVLVALRALAVYAFFSYDSGYGSAWRWLATLLVQSTVFVCVFMLPLWFYR